MEYKVSITFDLNLLIWGQDHSLGEVPGFLGIFKTSPGLIFSGRTSGLADFSNERSMLYFFAIPQRESPDWIVCSTVYF